MICSVGTLRSAPLSPASSILSDFSQPPTKKRRISTSSLSDADDNEDDDDEDEDEDQPLAARMSLKTSSSEKTSRPVKAPSAPISAPGPVPAQRSGKKEMSSMKSKSHTTAHTAPASLAPPTGQTQAEMNGVPIEHHTAEVKIKEEDRMDERQLSRLATGVTFDTRATSVAVRLSFSYVCSRVVIQ